MHVAVVGQASGVGLRPGDWLRERTERVLGAWTSACSGGTGREHERRRLLERLAVALEAGTVEGGSWLGAPGPQAPGGLDGPDGLTAEVPSLLEVLSRVDGFPPGVGLSLWQGLCRWLFERSRLRLDASDRRAEQERGLGELATVCVSLRSLDEVLEAALHALQLHTGAQSVAALEAEIAGGTYSMRGREGTWAVPVPPSAAAGSLAPGEDALEGLRPLAPQAHRGVWAGWSAGEGGRSGLLVALLGPEVPEDAELARFCERVARVVSAAGGRLAAEERAHFLHEASRRLAESMELSATAATFARMVVPRFGEASAVLVLEEQASGLRLRRAEVCGTPADEAGLREAGLREAGLREAGLRDAELREAGLCEAILEADVFPCLQDRVHAQKCWVLPGLPASAADFLARTPEHRAMLELFRGRGLVVVPLAVRGRRVGVLAVARDLRPGQPLDSSLLEELARRGAVALHNARLFEESERFNKMRQHMLAVVSHDLRAPLASILLFAARLMKPNLPPPEPSRVGESIHRAAQRMRRLVDDLTDIAAIQAKKLRLDRRPWAPRSLVAEVLDARADPSRPVQASATVPAGLPHVLCDRDRVLQVLENLVANALGATRQGEVVVHAAVQEAEVRFDVRDTGAGISPDELRHVFDEYFRGRDARWKGTGMGLAICRAIVESHGGRIWAESKLGSGSCFSFTLPVAAAPSPTG